MIRFCSRDVFGLDKWLDTGDVPNHIPALPPRPAESILTRAARIAQSLQSTINNNMLGHCAWAAYRRWRRALIAEGESLF